MKLTKMEPRDALMPQNQHGSATYGEWCKAEVERIGSGAVYVEEVRGASGSMSAKAWCRVDRI